MYSVNTSSKTYKSLNNNSIIGLSNGCNWKSKAIERVFEFKIENKFEE